MSAVTAVFDTTELLEAILSRVDTKTLLLAQRVEKRWQQVINNSKSLLKKLFFLPTNTFDDILDLGFLDVADSEKYNILDSTSNRSKWLEQVVIMNDLLFDTTREWKLRSVAFASPHSPPSDVTPSWKRMLLTQPPPSTGNGDVMFWFEDARDNDELCEEVDTMGEMMQKIYGKERRLRGFHVSWDTAAVRPVKHPVAGTYYVKLLNQRQREREIAAEEELMEVTVFDSKGEIEQDPAVEEARSGLNSPSRSHREGDDETA
ncbi:hypothetical protein AC578_7593 [Lecanosticta acicola]|uniref:F-box domain-containing protein n=1 Tax=Lecanosticta acicola TaxID=111012 RepID=A0AAI9EE58_9PEZI|nr:hypothetical protein AC578_7593 [Lecanosticta acicola]